MQRLIYSKSGGMGILLEPNEKEEDFFENKSFEIAGQTISPGSMTDLCSLFSEPIRFVGALKEDLSVMVFHLGSDTDLFGEVNYYSCFIWLTPLRVCNRYSEGTVRDYHLRDGKFL